MKEDKLFQVIKKQIDACDVYRLLECGAPNDEYDIESNIIRAQIKKGMTSHSIAEIIAQVMIKQFKDKFTPEEFIHCAEIIEKFLNNDDLD